MEEDVVKTKNNRFILGVVLAFIGAMVATIPWVVAYVHFNLMWSALAIIIAIGAFLGYKISKATIDKKLPIVIIIVSLISITISTLVIIPLLLISQEGLEMSIENLKFLYGYDEFKSAIIQDYIISLVFTILGISGTVASLNNQIKGGVAQKDIKIMNNSQNLVKEESLKKVKDAFIKYNAIDEMHKIDKTEILNEIEDTEKVTAFNYLKNSGIIKKSKGKYYYSEEAEKNPKQVNKQTNKITLIIIIAIVIIMCIPIFIEISDENNNLSQSETITQEISGTDMKIQLTNDFELLTDEEIDYIQGTGASDLYEFIAMDSLGTKAIYCYKIDQTEFGEEITPREYLEYVFEGLENIELETREISGFNLEVAKYTYEYEEDQYIEQCAIYEQDNEFICIDLVYLATNNLSLDEIIK